MHLRSNLFIYCCFVCLVLFSNSALIASIVGLDNASATAYDDGWTSGDNGSILGSPFTGWTLNSNGFDSGFFIGDSTGLASPGADINSAGESFGLFGHSGQTATATRSFNGGGLLLGQMFSIDIAVNFRNGNKGINLDDASGNQLFNFNVGGDDYTAQGSSIGDAFGQDTSFNLKFTQTSAAGGTWQVSRFGEVLDFDTGTYSGIAGGFELYVSGTENGGPQNNFFANNISIVPEPTTLATFGIALAALVRRRRRV